MSKIKSISLVAGILLFSTSFAQDIKSNSEPHRCSCNKQCTKPGATPTRSEAIPYQRFERQLSPNKQFQRPAQKMEYKRVYRPAPEHRRIMNQPEN